jgi:nicotinamide phosphoribosyltransferase
MYTNIRSNPLVLTDAYNLSHSYLKINTDWEVSHIYNRKSGMVLFGFHELVVTFLENVKVTEEMITEAEECARSMGLTFPSELFKRVVEECDGKIPLKVECLPEGTFCPAGTPFAQISNTKGGFGELVTWWEAIFLHGYFASSCATEAMNMFIYLEEIRKKYGFKEQFLSRFHSFGFRGHRSLEDAYWAGSAWSIFLHGSDDFHITKHWKDAKLKSIPALAHKVVQQFDIEYDCFLRAIEQCAERLQDTVALVIDTYSAYIVINEYVLPLANYAKGLGIDIAFRPDSGDTWKQAVDIYDIVRDNELENVSVIIGEGMSLAEAKKADLFFQKNNVPLTFINYGIGAGFYKHIERDTLGWAMKTAWSNGKPRMKFSENPMKRSTPGVVGIYRCPDTKEMVVELKDNMEHENMFHTIYNEGKTCSQPTLDDVRKRIFKDMEERHTEQMYIRSSKAIKELVKEFKRINLQL